MDIRSNEPFWLVKNGLISSYPSLKEDINCDILVVGGGITGSLIAHQMVQDGYETVLIDRREIGNGSTSVTTSMLQYEIDVPLFQLENQVGRVGAIMSYKACHDAIDKLDELATEINSKAGFERKKSLYFASRRSDRNLLQKELKARSAAGFEVTWLDPSEIYDEYQIRNTYSGILSQQGASVDAFRLAHDLLDFNIKKGLRVFDKSNIKRVKYQKSDNIAITDSGHNIVARKIIYCPGYEAVELIKNDFVSLKSTFAMVSEPNEEAYKRLENLLVWNTDEPYLYLRTTTDHRLLVGGGDENYKNAARRDAMISRKEGELFKALGKFMHDYPFYRDFNWAGTFGETKDGLPYIGTHKHFTNTYFVLGFGGNGITFSVAGMAMASAWMLNKDHLLSEYFKFNRD